MQGLSEFAGIEANSGPDDGLLPYGDSVRESLLAALFASNSRYAGVMITDMLGLEDRINVPGVMGENWVYRIESSVEDLRRNPHWAYLAERMKKLLIESGRASTLVQADLPEPTAAGESTLEEGSGASTSSLASSGPS
jgi:hypothetical protein